MNIAVIPARGGSKRIPRKNLRSFCGKPILAYSIEAALTSGLFEEVMVSTDDNEIAEIAGRYGAKVPFLRSPGNSDDFATTADVLLEVLGKYRPVTFEILCCIYPTAPFVNAELLKRAFDKLIAEELDSVFPVMVYSHPIQRALLINEENRIELAEPRYMHTRSQDLEKRYHDAGQFYMCRVSGLVSKKKVWTDRSGGLVISEMHAHDIDNEDDWKMAEIKYKLMHDA